MSFWTDALSKEPLRQFRWFLRFGNPRLESYKYALKDCKKPSYRVETTQHVLINHTYNYPKNLVWQPIEFTYVSARNAENDEGLTRVFSDITLASGYLNPRQVNALRVNSILTIQDTVSKSRFDSSLGFIELYQVDSNGEPIEIWKLFNPIITGIDYGSLTYEQEGFVDVKVSLSYDYAEMLVPLGTYNSEKYTTIGGSYTDSSNKVKYYGTPGFSSPPQANPNRIQQTTPALNPTNTTKTD